MATGSPTSASFDARYVHSFLPERHAGPPTPFLMLRAMEETRRQEEEVELPVVPRRVEDPPQELETPEGRPRRIVFSGLDDNEDFGRVASASDMAGPLSKGDFVLFEKGGVAKLRTADPAPAPRAGGVTPAPSL